MKKIFISHSSKDEIIADALKKLLIGGLGINVNEVLCTSSDGARIQVAENWLRSIKENMRSARIVFFIISTNFKTSEVAQNELGAAWVTNEQKIVPLYIEPITPDTIGPLLAQLQAAKLSDGVVLESVRTKAIELLGEEFDERKFNATEWASAKSNFVGIVAKYEKKIRRNLKLKKIYKLIRFIFPFLLLGVACFFVHKPDISCKFCEKEKLIYKAAADFEGFDLKIGIQPNSKSDHDYYVLSQNFDSAIKYQYIESFSSVTNSSNRQFILKFFFPDSLIKNTDSIDVFVSKNLEIRLVVNDEGSRGFETKSIENWQRKDTLENYIRFRYQKALKNNIEIKLNFP